MKREFKANGSKPRIVNVTGEPDAGLLASTEALWASQAGIKMHVVGQTGHWSLLVKSKMANTFSTARPLSTLPCPFQY